MVSKFSFLFIIVAIFYCVSIGVVFSGKVNADGGPTTVLVKWDGDSDVRPPGWGKKKDKKDKDKKKKKKKGKGKKDKGSDDKSSDDSSSDDSSSDDSSSDDSSASPHH